MHKRFFAVLTLGLSMLLANPRRSLSQNKLFDDILVGASLNYSTLHYKSGMANDLITSDFDYEIHALLNKHISNSISLQTGFMFFVFSYKFEDSTSPQTNENGEPTGNYLKSFMAEDFSTSYLGLPLHVLFHPFSKKRFFLIAGPDISYKVGHSNGVYKTELYSGNGEKIQDLLRTEYTLPESSNNFLLSATAGMGYDIPQRLFPLTLMLEARHSITHYAGGEDHVSSWTRGVSLSISYRF